jgi:hypothetical protein
MMYIKRDQFWNRYFHVNTKTFQLLTKRDSYSVMFPKNYRTVRYYLALLFERSDLPRAPSQQPLTPQTAEQNRLSIKQTQNS